MRQQTLDDACYYLLGLIILSMLIVAGAFQGHIVLNIVGGMLFASLAIAFLSCLFLASKLTVHNQNTEQ